MMLRLLLPAIWFALLLSGCNQKTTISREDQLKDHPQMTTADTTADTIEVTEASKDATGATEDTAVADQTDAIETTDHSEPKETQAEETKPKETKPQSSKPQETKPAVTEPQKTEPEETNPEVTEPEETKPEITEPEETGAEVTEPEETKAEVTEPDTSNEIRDISGYSMGQLEYAIVDAMNAHRTAAGLSPLSINHRLSAICSVRAYECTLNWGHNRPNGSSCFTVLADYDYNNYSMIAENLLYCTVGFTAEEMVEGWMNSEGHRANIMNPNYHITGVDVYEYNGLLYVAAFYTD